MIFKKVVKSNQLSSYNQSYTALKKINDMRSFMFLPLSLIRNIL